MAIVQISRIQNRRGRELTETGIPQLASGEFGWAVDTQKLYIGNGSTAEGSPAVGNTNVLTEHTDILALANQYVYKENSNLWIQAPAQPSSNIASKLDQVTTVFDFGVVGDGIVDDTIAFQNAIDSLYLQALDETDRVALRVPAGLYKINGTLYIPPFVTLIGDGVGKTIITTQPASEATSQDVLFKTVNGDSDRGSYTGVASTVPVDAIDATQARHIYISDMTVRQLRVNAAFELEECARSVFRNLKIEGIWVKGGGDAATYGEANYRAFLLTDPATDAPSKENLFENIQVTGFYDGVYNDHENDKNIFRNMNFRICYRGITFGSTPRTAQHPTGPSLNTIENCSFDFIHDQGIWIGNGEYNVSRNNKFYNVGKNIGTGITPSKPVIEFTNNYTNLSINDYFARTAELAEYDNAPMATFLPNVIGRVDVTEDFRNSISIGYTLSIVDNDGVIISISETKDIIKLPLIDNETIYVDYLYIGFDDTIGSEKYFRKEGTITIQLHTNDGNDLSVSDDAMIQGDTAYIDEVQFSAEITGGEIVLKCKNLISSDTTWQDTFLYKTRVKS